MVRKIYLIWLVFFTYLQINAQDVLKTAVDEVSDFKILLTDLANKAEDKYFKIHCHSILEVIQSKMPLSKEDSALLITMFHQFSETSGVWSGRYIESYTQRKRPYIISWNSRFDTTTSVAWLILPENWDPEVSYPLYVRLHGLASVYEDIISYMAYYFKPENLVSASFENGYILLPWGRGNLWYQNAGETDVWESMDVLDSIVKIDKARKCLTGFSMGGFGTWYLGQKSPEIWAALGIYSGALAYDSQYFNEQTAYNLREVPTYIVCGTQDGLYSTCQKAYNFLKETGNTQLVFTSFEGGHVTTYDQWRLMYEWMMNYSNPNNPDVLHPEENLLYLQAYPNPLTIQTHICFTLTESGKTNLIVLNITGQIVKTLMNSTQSPGEKEFIWNGDDDKGRTLPKGIYFCNLKTSKKSTTIKLLLQ